MIATGYSKSRLNLSFAIPYVSTLAQRARKIRNMGSAGLSLTYVAMGRFDCYFELSINLWDFAAGALIIKQAGGEFWCEDGVEPNTYRMIADNGRLRKKLPPLPPKPDPKRRPLARREPAGRNPAQPQTAAPLR